MLPLLVTAPGHPRRGGRRGRARRAVGDCFAEARNGTGLGHYQVRRCRAWYRHITVSMLAHAFLAVTARSALPEKGA